MITKEHLLRYEELKLAEKEIQRELDELSEGILNMMIDQDVEETPQLSAGKVVLIKRKKWQFSPSVETMKDTLDRAQTIEKANGVATFEIVPYIKYQQ